MKAMVFAAGRGKRMRHLTDHTAKPLLPLWGRPLIEYQLKGLVRAGVRDIVVNTAHFTEHFDRFVCPEMQKENEAQGLFTCAREVLDKASIHISKEGTCYEEALETRGGIIRALPFFQAQPGGSEPFIVTSGDVVTSFDYSSLEGPAKAIREGKFLAHLVLVPNPPFHPEGDMGIEEGLCRREPRQYTYGNIALFSPRIFQGVPAGRAPLFPWLYEAIDAGKVSASLFAGAWANIGTPEDLAFYETQLDLLDR